MSTKNQISGLVKLGNYINLFLNGKNENFTKDEEEFQSKLNRAEVENRWFSQENLRFCLKNWADLFTQENLENWISTYEISKNPKKVGLILAGNIPLVGLHDVLSVVFSNHIALIKLSSKDKVLLPFLLEKWEAFSAEKLQIEYVERLIENDAVIATGSNNTARYLEYYFKDKLSIIRKNRTSISVLKGDETNEDLQLLAKDIFKYFGLGCRNVTKLFIPEDFKLDRLFENFFEYSEIINHNSYANNYDYHKAILLLNQDVFWDNNFVMLKEETSLFSALSIIHFTRYKNISEVEKFIAENKDQIQCIVAQPELNLDSINFGEAQYPKLDDYADNVDTMKFLEVI
ncbi:acyl-CoA reductase [Frigoriflavimonas asaccharolytica]|uniref:Acyl-CoA reductase n=1 Tax=Frigoriflavimonas asaccharolytica TaxID=2735899 RepID=A0A8J8K9F9_9FLAO|nr:acyl-CoA reductase [Frigoriflavimonas asaccharolytica]NRS93032.1 hypothetical protein [Frigoriflavimonas asaccharolytica]